MSARDRAGDLYCSFFDDAEDAIAIARVDGLSFLHANPAFCRLLGRSCDDIVGKPLDAIHPPDNVDEVRALFLEQTKSARNIAESVPCVRGDGSVIRCDVVMQLLRTPAGVVALGFFSPSQERHPVLQTTFEAERQLRRLDGEFHQLLQSLPMSLAVLDDAGAIELVNERFLELFGYTRAEVPDLESWWRRAYPDPAYRERVRQIWEAAVREAAATGSDIRVDQEARITCKDGSVRQVEVVGRRVGRRQVLVLRDQTQRRAAERALRESEAQLRHAHKMEAVGRLAGSVAHDFNNLLTGIVGNIAIIKHEVEDAELKLLCEEVEVGGKRTAELVRQLLSFSRKELLATQPLDVDELVQGVSRVIEKLLGEKVRLRLTRAPKLPVVLGDRGQLEQVLVNLAINARDAMMPDGGELAIESSLLAGEGAEPGGQVCLTIRDQGCGMSESVRARIFEPFFTTKGRDKGSGLGLSIVYGIVERHGGRVEVSSAPGRGTTFRVSLPVPCEPVDVVASPQLGQIDADAGEPPVLGDHGHGRTLLLVEDDPMVLSIAARSLEQAGYAVLTAVDAAAALDALGEQRLDALVTDVVMPGMDGRELADRVRARYPELPVLFISGYTGDVIAEYGVKTDGTELLRKPFRPHQLVNRVARLLGA